ncbi:MAG: YfcE family phosphodiesterase [Coriobacteriia bacterium]|nr:YfcE family phosphodiesterase [Coriobacteriia bacterium]
MNLSEHIDPNHILEIAPDEAWPEYEGIKLGLIADTHGKLSAQAYKALEHSELILHAGDIVGQEIIDELETIAPLRAVLGNNDYVGEYGPAIGFFDVFKAGNLRFKLIHKPSDIGPYDQDVIVFGHTHRPHFEYIDSQSEYGKTLLINPGSCSRSRSSYGHTVARLIVNHDEVVYFALVRLDEKRI